MVYEDGCDVAIQEGKNKGDQKRQSKKKLITW